MEIRDTMQTMQKYVYDIFLINDCSPDNTFEVIKTLCEKYDRNQSGEKFWTTCGIDGRAAQIRRRYCGVP